MTEAQQATEPPRPGGEPHQRGVPFRMAGLGLFRRHHDDHGRLVPGHLRAVALFDDTYYLVADSGLVVSVDYTTWGWIHLLLGVVAAAAGLAVMAGRMWGRTVGIILAVISAIVNMLFIAAYPVWSIIIITLDVIIIYALAVHGGEAKD